MSIDDLTAARTAAGIEWDTALAAGDIDAGEACAARVRALSREIADHVSPEPIADCPMPDAGCHCVRLEPTDLEHPVN